MRLSFLPPVRVAAFCASRSLCRLTPAAGAAAAILILAGAVTARPAPAADENPVDPAVARTYLDRVEKELRGDILPFWLAHVRDREHQGIFNEITNDLVVDKKAPRGALLTSRVLWTFSAAYRRYHDPAYLEMAQWVYRDLIEHFRDERNGGLYWSITFDGKPLDQRKIIYGQVFGVYALSEYYRATGDHAALDQALAIYRAIEEHAHDRVNGGYREEFTADWKLNAGKSAMGSEGPKSQNAHIHILEGYTNLLRAWPDPELKENLRGLIDVLLTKILDPQTHHLHLFLTDEWKPRSTTISFGHDIEFSWLVVEAAEVLGDPVVIKRAEENALAIARVTADQGVDADGGLFYEAEPGKGLTNPRKDWWPQAEAAVGFLGAYQLSGNVAYFRRAMHSWDFIDAHLIDRKYGGWLWGVTRAGRPLPGRVHKVSFWKCPYHNGRSCMELIDRLTPIAAPAK